jgi:site-specific DNA recombinase
MSVKHPSARHSQATVYRCNGVYRDRWGCPAVSVTAHMLDTAVWARVTEVLLNPDIIEAEVKRRRAAQSTACDVEAIERQMAVVDRQRQNLIRSLAMLEDEDSARLLTAELATLTAQHKQLDRERAAKVSQQAEESAETARLSSLVDWTTRAATNLSTLTYAEKRMLLEALAVSVGVWKTDHEPRWELTMAPVPPDSDSSIVFKTSFGISGMTARF